MHRRKRKAERAKGAHLPHCRSRLTAAIGFPVEALQILAPRFLALAKNVARDIVEIGRHLSEARDECKHGEWLPWLEKEFAWSRRTADNFMNVYEMTKVATVATLPDLPIGALYALAAPSTPEAARETVIEAASAGETLTRAEVAFGPRNPLASHLVNGSQDRTPRAPPSRSSARHPKTPAPDRREARRGPSSRSRPPDSPEGPKPAQRPAQAI
jgi:hypothetical protein